MTFQSMPCMVIQIRTTANQKVQKQARAINSKLDHDQVVMPQRGSMMVLSFVTTNMCLGVEIWMNAMAAKR